MRCRLREDVHWCNCGGRAVFLDLKADRYFCLSRGANAAFLRVAANEPHSEDPERLTPLVRHGLLVEGDAHHPLQPPATVDAPHSDFLSGPDARAGVLNIMRAIFSELRIAWLLRQTTFVEVI